MQISNPCTRDLNLVALGGCNRLCRQAPQGTEGGS